MMARLFLFFAEVPLPEATAKGAAPYLPLDPGRRPSGWDQHGMAMMKRKIEIDDPWEYQITYMIRKGYDPEQAKLATIILWANAGDLRPLQRAIAEATKLDGSEMVAIDGGYLASFNI
jgi:hypothetical protein